MIFRKGGNMNILFDEKTRTALIELVNESTENYIRIKPFYGCGKPAYEMYVDYKRSTDIEEEIQGIIFIVNADDEKACNGIEIKYDKEVYNNGYYIKSL